MENERILKHYELEKKKPDWQEREGEMKESKQRMKSNFNNNRNEWKRNNEHFISSHKRK